MRIPSLPVRAELGPIPRVVHQIWAGGHPPVWVTGLWDRWDVYAQRNGIEIRRWFDNDIARTVSGRVGFEHMLTPVKIADLLRLELMSLQGGLYMDSDTVPLQSLQPYFGDRPGWLAHGQDWTKAGDPTVSNAMMGMPAGTQFMSQMFEHAVKAIDRGVKNTFDIAGPSAYRRILTEEMGIEIAHQDTFPAFRAKQKRAEEALGRPLNDAELRAMYPAARVVHLSAESWVAGKIEKRGL